MGHEKMDGVGATHTEHANPKKMPDHLDDLSRVHTQIDVIETTTESPYREVNFMGTYAAIALGCCGAFAGFIMPVTSLQLINADIGPSPNLTWVALAWTLLSSIGFTLVGRLSDIFGRRWFFIGCNLLATIGCIVGATAKNVNQLIGASVLLGFGAAGQISFNFLLGELVPVRHRFAANGIIFLCTLPFAGLGPWISRLFIAHTSVGWRGDYYLSLAINASATICWVIWYHPPKFDKLHKDRTMMQEVRDMDFGGIFLFTGGSLLFLLGLSWGGELYPWKSANVIATLVVGFVLLVIFVFYETFMPLRRPLIPMHLFRNYDYVVLTTLSTVGGMVYYSMSVLFPQMVAALFTQDVVYGGLLSCAVGGGVCCGQFFGSWAAVPGGHLRFKLMFIAAGLCAFIGAIAGATGSKNTAVALATLGGIMVGLLEVIVSTAVTIVIDDQSEIGTASGVFGSLRGAGGVLATAIYVSILTNKITSNIKTIVAPALVKAGLPPTSIMGFIAAAQTGELTKIEAVPGVNMNIIEAGTIALKEAYAGAFKTVFLASIAFGALAFISACFSKNIDHKLSHDVIRRLDRKDIPMSSKEVDEKASDV